jgi:hypothetical protein
MIISVPELSPEIDPDTAALLETVAKGQRRFQDTIRRTIAVMAVVLGVVTSVDVIISAKTWGQAIQFGLLGLLGLISCLGQIQLVQALVSRDGEVLARLHMAAKMASVRPLLSAIREAHDRGEPLVIQPDEEPTE